jgi:phosphate transport system substrate-binding protein
MRSLKTTAIGTAWAAAFALLLVSANGCGGGKKVDKLAGAGSSFIDPLMQKWAKVYKDDKKIDINYSPQGSTAGINQMTEKSVDIGCTDAPMTDEQLGKAKEQGGEVVHIPLIMGGVVPAYNLDGIDEPLQLSGEVLAGIFLGDIKKWNDEKIVTLQGPNVKDKLKAIDHDIITVHRADGSGTTNIFTDYLSKVSSEWKSKIGMGTKVAWPEKVGSAEQGTAGVAKFITGTKFSIGYIELTYALANSIKFAKVKNKAGNYVLASLETVSKAAEGAVGSLPEDLRYSLTYQDGADSYPITGTTWAVVFVDQPKDRAEVIKEFLRWVTHDGQKYAKELSYAPLPQPLVERVDKKIDMIKAK